MTATPRLPRPAPSCGEARRAPTLGVLVPARDEAAVLPRKVRNLARLAWPAHASTRSSGDEARRDAGPPRTHRVVIVDDGSSDGSGALARTLLEREFGVPGVVASVVRAAGEGKARAIARGLEALHDVDLVVLTDADVVLREGALLAVAEAFAEDSGLLLACGAQELVRDLTDDGSTRGAGGGPPVPASELYDRLTARVRAFESRFARVFSVHGQLLAWRADAALAPTPGIAADDLDLMLRARAAGGGVRLVPGARFLEAKPCGRALRRGQGLRRARAYFQVLRAWSGRRPLGESPLDRAQWAFYRCAPALLSWTLGAMFLLVSIATAVRWGAGSALGLAALAALLSSTSLGRELLRLAWTIERARRTAAAGAAPDLDRWEPPREVGR